MALAGAIAWLSLAVAPDAAKSNGWSVLAVILGGLAVAGGVVYLSEKLINTGKGVGDMVLAVFTEKFKQHEREAGIKIGEKRGREQERRATNAWYERQQAAFRAGLPFDEPPPGYAPESHANGAEGG